MELRGFDSYDVSLGDEMRGERASLGKSLEDAERDMRIKAPIIHAIEACDLDGFPNPSVISGYVRSYARYLGMDPEVCFARFCEESGYVSPSALSVNSCGRSAAGEGGRVDTSMGPGAQLGRSRFATTVPRRRMVPMVSLGALTSATALVGLIAGLAYGGYALLQDIQRVGFAPLPEAPAVVAEAPQIGAPTVDMEPVARPDASDYQGGGLLAAQAMPTELPPVGNIRRDGPISAIDPASVGLFAEAEPPLVQPETLNPAELAFDDFSAPEPLTSEAEVHVGLQGVALIASEEAWIRVREGESTVLFEGILDAGERFELPATLADPVLRAGNAGGIFIFVDGVAYGPVGERGRVAKGVSLRADDIRSTMPQVGPDDIRPAEAPSSQRRAEAAVPSN